MFSSPSSNVKLEIFLILKIANFILSSSINEDNISPRYSNFSSYSSYSLRKSSSKFNSFNFISNSGNSYSSSRFNFLVLFSSKFEILFFLSCSFMVSCLLFRFFCRNSVF